MLFIANSDTKSRKLDVVESGILFTISANVELVGKTTLLYFNDPVACMNLNFTFEESRATLIICVSTIPKVNNKTDMSISIRSQY